LGLRQVRIAQIVGSAGRYHDFDRAFLPVQVRTRARWISIGQAHYEDIPLPPVELIKLGEIYFVQDGNHRVSVAHERGQEYIDAFVIEVEIPIRLTPDLRMDELGLKGEQAEFYFQTQLDRLRPDQAALEFGQAGNAAAVLEHISVHRWYLGERRQAETPYSEAVTSWFDTVYTPVAELIREQGLLSALPGTTEADLYLWIMTYQGALRQAYREEAAPGEGARLAAARQLANDYALPEVRRLIEVLSRVDWIDSLILAQERSAFLESSGLSRLRPQAGLEITLPLQYDRLREHIAAHRWYLGEQRKAEPTADEAAASWYDTVYLPLVETIREGSLLDEFPGRTETDLYLWIIEHQWYLQEAYGDSVPMEQAAERFAGDFSEKKRHNPKRRLFQKRKP
jgi:hypothetical protein